MASPARSRSGNTDRAKTARPEKRRVATRAEKTAGRRDAIVAAALEEFAARGFAAARLDDVARRAGVAKGTIYLHFKDKEALFAELLRTELVPRVSQLAAPIPDGVPTRAVLEAFVDMFVREVYGTRRADILRLVIAEGRHLPDLAEFYYREVVERGVKAMVHLIERGVARGEIRHSALARFPQLVIAPALVAVIWQSLFGKLAPLDAAGMMRAHIELIFDTGRPA